MECVVYPIPAEVQRRPAGVYRKFAHYTRLRPMKAGGAPRAKDRTDVISGLNLVTVEKNAKVVEQMLLKAGFIKYIRRCPSCKTRVRRAQGRCGKEGCRVRFNRIQDHPVFMMHGNSVTLTQQVAGVVQTTLLGMSRLSSAEVCSHKGGLICNWISNKTGKKKNSRSFPLSVPIRLPATSYARSSAS